MDFASFRVENRRARPKIVQKNNSGGVLDQGVAYFSKQACILNSTQKKPRQNHRRGISSPGTEFLFALSGKGE